MSKLKSIEELQVSLNLAIENIPFQASPAELYEPISYILSLGGKRLRPALVLMAADMYGFDVSKAMPQALGVELFHNFTLMKVSNFVYKKYKNTYIVNYDEFFILL